jgi:hypothetical protein
MASVAALARPRDPLTAPREGGRVSSPPLLRWIPQVKASFYNVQVYRLVDGQWRKVLSAWPSSPRLQMRWRWSGGRFVVGRYLWYVWPGFGTPADARYGRLIGSSTFSRVR